MIVQFLTIAFLAGGALALAFDRERRRERAAERRERVWELERKDLLDRIMFLTDKTWSIPPAEAYSATTVLPPVPLSDEVSYDPLYEIV